MSLQRRNKYSVLLEYPEYTRTDFYGETYYTMVHARNVENAIALAQERCMKDNRFDIETARDCKPVLVLGGHHYALELP